MASPPRAISSRPPLGPAGSPAASRSITLSPFSTPGRALPPTANVKSFIFAPSALLRFEIPVEDLLASPEQHALLLAQAAQHALEVLDPVRHAGDVGVHRERHHFRAFGALPVNAVEIVHAARL